MIEDEFVYDDSDEAIIKSYLNKPENERSSNDWSEFLFSDLKIKIKNFYKEKQDYTCPYCKIRFKQDHNLLWDLEHIIPRENNKNFMFTPRNLCVSCRECNGAKHNKNVLLNKGRKTFPTESDDYMIVHPHYDDYEKHIQAIVPGDFYRPLTEKGKNTIYTCDLLRFYKYVDRKHPNEKIDALAKTVISAAPQAREIIENLLIEAIQESRRT